MCSAERASAPRTPRDADTDLILPLQMSLLAGKSGFPVAVADFQGVVCEWCLLPGFGHDDCSSLAKYSQIENSGMKSRINSCLVKAFPLGVVSEKAAHLNES